MNRFFIISLSCWLIASFHAFSKPLNVVFILADDLGWADTTLYGKTSLYKTPNLDRLAKRGMLFSRSYSTPLCSPTRASILTGQTTLRHGSTEPTHHKPEENLRAKLKERAGPLQKLLRVETANRLDTSLPTLGKQFKAAGYATAHFGKWHLGSEPYSPLEHGFDVDIPHYSGPGPAGAFVAPWRYKNFESNRSDEHIEDRMAEEAVKWMKSVKDKPFFLNYWMFSVHSPFDAKENLIQQYRSEIDLKNPQHSPTYAAMVHSMDDAVGTLLDAIDAAGIANQTVIVFSSDNGGNMYNGIKEIDDLGQSFIASPTSNAPLRGGKATMYEGGVRVPTVIAWPGVTKPSSRCDEIIQCIDFYPTFLKELGLSLPKDHVVDGINMMPALKGGKIDRKGIFTYFPHNPMVPDWLPPSISVHAGDWKLIRLFNHGENGAHEYRLYNLKQDLGETSDLSKEKPELVQELDQLIQAHIDDTKGVIPLPNPQFDPSKYVPKEIGVQPGGLKVENKAKKPNQKNKAE
jgi:arylsulfatase A-like enzyme